MGTLLRLLLHIAGYRFFERSRLSPVSKTIDLFPLAKSRRWLYGGIFHFLPVLLGLVLLFIFRPSPVLYRRQEFIALFSAAAWGFVGPAAIWYYERYTLPILELSCRKFLTDETDKRLVRRAIYASTLGTTASKVIVTIWMIAVVVGFARSQEVVSSFGLRGYSDPLWLFLAAGVVVFSFYTALGFCFAYRSILVLRLIAKASMKDGLYHLDRVMGLSFIGQFALSMNTMFLSGWLYAPVLFLGARDTGIWLTLIAGYSLFMLSVFMIQILLIHNKILLMKKSLVDHFGIRASAALAHLANQCDADLATEFSLHRSVIEDVHSVRNWPMSLDVAISFTLSTIVLPVLVGLAVVWWGTPNGP